jgi:hypothetical protein
MWTLVTIAALLVGWGSLWRSQPKLAFGVLLGLPVAWVASRLTEPYFAGTAEFPLWLPPLPFAVVATTLLVFGGLVWLRADSLPPPLVRDTHGGYGGHAHGPAPHSDETPASSAAGARQPLPTDDLAAALELMRLFVGRQISAQEFATEYKVVWRRLRDADRLAAVDPYLHRSLNVVLDAIESIERPSSGKSLATHASELGLRVATILNVVDQAA